MLLRCCFSFLICSGNFHSYSWWLSCHILLYRHPRLLMRSNHLVHQTPLEYPSIWALTVSSDFQRSLIPSCTSHMANFAFIYPFQKVNMHLVLLVTLRSLLHRYILRVFCLIYHQNGFPDIECRWFPHWVVLSCRYIRTNIFLKEGSSILQVLVLYIFSQYGA